MKRRNRISEIQVWRYSDKDYRRHMRLKDCQSAPLCAALYTILGLCTLCPALSFAPSCLDPLRRHTHLKSYSTKRRMLFGLTEKHTVASLASATVEVPYEELSSSHKPQAQKPQRIRSRSPSISLTEDATNRVSSPRQQKPSRKTKLWQNGRTKHIETSFLENEIFHHDLLTKEEEIEHGRAVQLALKVKDRMETLLLSKQQESEAVVDDDDDEEEDEDEDDTMQLSLYRIHNNNRHIDEKDPLSSLYTEQSHIRDGGALSSFSFSSLANLTPTLTADDVKKVLGSSSSINKLQTILRRGARARQELTRSNFRLVVSIAKTWAKQTRASGDAKHSVFSGSWNRPSLNEAIQEGIIGLIQAVDKFDPERNLRFSTYATFWITNSIRRCFQRASTGCLRVPVKYYDVRSNFKKLVKNFYDTTGSVPDFSVLAETMNIKPSRLHKILRLTRPLISTDMPVNFGPVVSAGKAGGGGGPEKSNGLISDTLIDGTQLPPETAVDLSLLRQSLENAMATELAPYERDIVRLRLGLDDGVARTTRQVVEEYGHGLTMNDVRSAETRAYKKLRSPHSLSKYKFLAYLDLADVDIATLSFR